MLLKLQIFILGLIKLAGSQEGVGYNIEEPILYDTFPSGFQWGVATASYQVIKMQLSNYNLIKPKWH